MSSPLLTTESYFLQYQRRFLNRFNSQLSNQVFCKLNGLTEKRLRSQLGDPLRSQLGDGLSGQLGLQLRIQLQSYLEDYEKIE